MYWLCVTIVTTREGIEPVTGCLYRLGVTGVEIEDAQDFEEFLQQNPRFWDYVEDSLYESMAKKPEVRFYLPAGASGEDTLCAVRESMERLAAQNGDGCFGPLTLSVCSVSEDDWAHSWKQYLKPMAVGKRLLICPQWEKPQQAGERAVLYIEPGMVFGSGAHETTRLCLEALEDAISPGDRVLDIGCGTGILAIGALLLGAFSALGVDINPAAEHVARGNAEQNGIDPGRFEVLIGDAVTDGKLRESIGGGYDLVCANIVADVIIALLPRISDFLRPGGRLVASGIIGERAGSVRMAAKAQGLIFEKEGRENDWVCLTYRLPG